MVTLSPSSRNLARRLLAVEAASQSADERRVHEVVRVFEKLQVSLTRVVGADGYRALLRRALALARAEAAALQGIRVTADGSIEVLEEVGDDADNSGVGVDSLAIALTAHLLGLLVTFIGESLMRRIVRAAWPETSLDEVRLNIEESS